MMKSRILWTILICFVLTVNVFCEELPIYSALRILNPPQIDGVLDDECWIESEKAEPFVAIGGKAVDVTTITMLCWDDRNLYIGFICKEPSMEFIKQRIKQRKIVGFGESIEVFLDTNYDRSTYKQLRVGITGERDSYSGSDPCPEIDDKWFAAVHLDKDQWTVEMAIPFELLSRTPQMPNILWGLNLNRSSNRRTVGKWTCWSDTKGAFATPTRFGRLVFADYSLWLRYYYTVRTGDLMKQIAEEVMLYPNAGKCFMPELNLLDKKWLEFLEAVSSASPDTGAKCKKIIPQGEMLVKEYEQLSYRLRLMIIEIEFR